MTPFVRPGDRLVIHPVEIERLRIGDLVMYRSQSEEAAVCHRLVQKKRPGGRLLLHLRGDAGDGAGEWVGAERVRGRVVAIQRRRRVVTLTDPLHRVAQYGIARCHTVLRAARWLKRGIHRLFVEVRDAEALARGRNDV